MQENHTILITRKHNKKITGCMINTAYIYLGTGNQLTNADQKSRQAFKLYYNNMYQKKIQCVSEKKNFVFLMF